jgi:putative acetyltransferase
MIIRLEEAADLTAIRLVVEAAFKRSDEANLIDRLRGDGDSVISLVALDGDEIVGHVLLSRIRAPFPALGLAPVSVKPECQHSGIGSGLIYTGLDLAQSAGWRGIFVLGDPAYYRRFGFDPALARGFTSAYSGPCLMVRALGTGLPTNEGVIEYARAFRTLG